MPASISSNALSDCLPMLAGDQCVLSAEGFFATGEPTSGSADLAYIYYGDATCTTAIAISSSASLPSSTQNTWVPLSITATAPSGTQTVRISYNIGAPATAPLTGHVDNVVSAAAPAPPVIEVPALSKAMALLLAAALAIVAMAALRASRG